MIPNLRLIGVNKDSMTAGPGKRFELFTKGCIRGVVAPCQGCFNEETWTFEGKYRGMPIDEITEIVERDAWNRQVTFCGGEPMLQAIALTEVAKRLKETDPTFHIIMYTAYLLPSLMKRGLRFTWIKEKHGLGMYDSLMSYSSSAKVLEVDEQEACSTKVEFQILTAEHVKKLMKYVDLIIDGDYKQDLRVPITRFMDEGQFIGSNNQRVIFCKDTLESGELKYLSPLEYNELRKNNMLCKCCGHIIPADKNKIESTNNHSFCDDFCKERYKNRNKEMTIYGGA